MCINKAINRIQESAPCAAVRYRIKRILNQEIDSRLFDEFYNSKWINLLRENQMSDGGYGRFHSRNSKLNQKFPTTERAVDSMKMLGIQRGNFLVDKLCDYMEKILKQEIDWPDGFESNEWYRTAQRIFVSSKLSVFKSDCKEYVEIFNCWHTILKEAFKEGKYNAERTNSISKELLGCSIDGSYIGLNSIYLIEFFANMQDRICDDLKLCYLKWLHHNRQKIYYTKIALNQRFDSNYTDMFRVYYLLSHFSCFNTEFEVELNWLRSIQSEHGLWNLGKDFSCQKLSDDWRSGKRMCIDHTIMVLLLLI